MKVRDKYLLIMAAVWGPCMALAVASYGLVLRPQTDHRHQIEARIEEAKEYYARALEAAKPELQARLTEEVGALSNRIADFLMRFEDVPELAFEVGNLAQKTRLESFGIKPIEGRGSQILNDADHAAEKRLHVSFVAGYARFAAFLNALERHDPIIFVETFTLDRPQDVDATPQADMGLAVLVERTQGI